MDDRARKEAGAAAESAAEEYLKSKGLAPLGRNYRCRGGEIDLVMLDEKILVLIEVRLRRNAKFGGAAASIDKRKQKRIVVAAKHLLLTRSELRKLRARFDVVALGGKADGKLSIEWIRDAFRV